MIAECAEAMRRAKEESEEKEEKEVVARIRVQFDEDEPMSEICYVRKNEQQWHLIELEQALYHFSVNDNMKLEIYEECHMKRHLKQIVYSGTEIEKEYSLRCLYQLSFDDTVAADLASDSAFTHFLRTLDSVQFKRAKLRKNIHGILFTITNKANCHSMLDMQHQQQQLQRPSIIAPPTSSTSSPPPDALPQTSPPSVAAAPPDSDKHIMISYNRNSRDLCLRIKNELEKDGLKCWIDVERYSHLVV